MMMMAGRESDGGVRGRGSSCPPATIHVRDENSSERMIYHQWSAIAILIYDINSQVVRPGSGSVLMDTIVALCVRVPVRTYVCVRLCLCVCVRTRTFRFSQTLRFYFVNKHTALALFIIYPGPLIVDLNCRGNLK